MTEPRPRLRAPTPRLGLIAGLAYPLRGARLVYREHRELARYYVPPLLLVALFSAVAAWLALGHRGEIAGWLFPEATAGSGLLGKVLEVGRDIVVLMALLVMLGGALVLAFLLAQLCGAPFHEALSQAVERIHSGESASQSGWLALVRDASRSVGLAAARLALYFAAMSPLWLLGVLVPGVGTGLQAILGFVVTVYFLALDHLDWAAARHGLTVSQRLALVPAYPATLFGFGLSVWLLLFVPGVGLLLLPAAVAGGTLLFGDIQSRPDRSPRVFGPATRP